MCGRRAASCLGLPDHAFFRWEIREQARFAGTQDAGHAQQRPTKHIQEEYLRVGRAKKLESVRQLAQLALEDRHSAGEVEGVEDPPRCAGAARSSLGILRSPSRIFVDVCRGGFPANPDRETPGGCAKCHAGGTWAARYSIATSVSSRRSTTQASGDPASTPGTQPGNPASKPPRILITCLPAHSVVLSSSI